MNNGKCIMTLLFWPIILIWGLFQTSLQVFSKCHCYLRVSLFWRFIVPNVLNRFLQRYEIDIDVYFKNYPLQYFYLCPWLIWHFYTLNFSFFQNKGLVEGLTWDCSDEFDATTEQPISFLSEQSFISFPNWISQTGAILSFKVQSTLSISNHSYSPLCDFINTAQLGVGV